MPDPAKLENPDMKYRPFNYWGWLEDIRPEEVKWQVAQMAKAGLGGYVMHARGGLLIPYMGERWKAAVQAMIDEGNKHGLTTIIDDEDGWPSGFGAGKVNGKGEKYWLKWIECERVAPEELQTTGDTLGVYRLQENKVSRVHGNLVDREGGNEERIHIYCSSSKYYVDNLDPDVVRAFLDASYEDYYGTFSEAFGNGIGAVFSDEPQIARGRITWSWILPAYFQERYGYDLIDVLPALFFDAEGCEKIRYDYWHAVSSLFTESYSRQIGEWCGQRQIAFMGHTAEEDGLAIQMMSSGSTMPFYEYMHVPGVDWLCRRDVRPITVKQVTSVGQQLGKERMLSEMYGCAGWNVSFAELKWIGEWHYVLGINFMLQHLGLYSLKGSRKREYPASLFFQQPWWHEFKPFNDYFARLSQLMSEGEPLIDILVIHPMRSAWIAFQGFSHDRVDRIEEEFERITDHLLALNYDFHYGDEEIIRKYGQAAGNRMTVGDSSYRTVIIPPSLSLDRPTVDLLLRFASGGGNVVAVGEFPSLIAGEPHADLDRLKQSALAIGNDSPSLARVLENTADRHAAISLCDGSPNRHVLTCARKYDGETVCLIVNTSRHNGFDVDITLLEQGDVRRLNLLDNTEEPVSSLRGVRLEPTESMLLAIREHGGARLPLSSSAAGFARREDAHAAISLQGEWEIVRADDNALTLDCCQYTIDQGPWQDEIPVIMLQEKLLALNRPADVAMKFAFRCEGLPSGSMFLVMEEPDAFDIAVNGIRLEGAFETWWIDKALKKIPIDRVVGPGENEIVLRRCFYCSDKVYRIKNGERIHEAESNRITVETELESLYLLGNFAVELTGDVREGERRSLFCQPSFTLSAPREKVVLQDGLVTQGFPFFAGSVTLSRKFILGGVNLTGVRTELTMDRPDAIVTRIRINGSDVRTLLWPPYAVDITPWLREGENEIALELINSCRNVFGPHHDDRGELYSVGPSSFSNKAHWTDEYSFVQFGISGMSIGIYRLPS